MNRYLFIFVILLFYSKLLIGQHQVSGVITDAADGTPMSFVAVEVVGDSTGGLFSDIDGRYKIAVPSNDATLRFSFLGYQTLNIPVNGRAVIDVVMNDDVQLLHEVVVVGYGVQKKSDITGSVSIVKVEDAKRVPTTNVAELLRGKSPGVQVTLNDPSPGGSSSIVFRGRSSLLAGSQPLYIVDGVPVENINGINTEDVVSMEILKDASAQAIYGARAGNGVILITTKRGDSGQFKVSYHGYQGRQKLTKNFDLYNGEEWANLRREAFRSENNDEYEPEDFVFTPLQLDVLASGEYVDWEKETIHDATQQNHSLTLSGGSKSTKIFTSFGYFNQSGIISGSGYKRGTARINLDHKVSDRFNFGGNIYLLTDKKNIRSGGLNFITLEPLAKVRDDNGDIIQFPTGDPNTINPLWNIQESVNEVFSNEYNLTLFGEYELVHNLKYKLNANLSKNNYTGGLYESRNHGSAFATNGRAALSSGNRSSYLIENILNYDLDVNKNNRFDLTFVQSVEQIDKSNFRVEATDFPNDQLGYNGIASAANILPVQRFAQRRRLLSFMGRLRYYLMDRYLFTFTARKDGSSVFAKNKKWAFFPAAAFAWKAHLEPWLRDLSAINELKIRLSYGSVGNQAISPYQTLGLASAENYIFGGVVYGGYQPGRQLFNPNLKWETSTTANLGIDFGLFNNFLVGNVEFYDKETTDLLIDRSTPQGTGYTSLISNIGKVQNRGVELGVTANLVRKEHFNWSLSTVFSKNQNSIKELFGEVDSLGNFVDDISKNRFIGEPINIIYQYAYDGIWQSEEEIAGSYMPDARPGDIRVKDVNGDGEITADDRVIFHKDPKWFGSLSTNIGFRGFELYADLYVVQGAMRSNSYLAGFNEGGTLQGVKNGIKVNYWTPENPTGTFPRPRRNETPGYIWAAAVSDASYIRLRTLSLAYHLPKAWLEKVNLNGVTLYGTASNLWTKTEYLSYSPEVSVGAYPDGKSFIFGIKINN